MIDKHYMEQNNIDDENSLCPTSLGGQASSSDYISSSLCVHCQHACTRWAAGIDSEGTEYMHWNDIAELEESAANSCIMCTQLLHSRTNSKTERAKEDILDLGPTRVRSTLTFLRLNTKSSKEEPNVVLEYAVLPNETQAAAQESEDESKVVVCTYLADLIRMDSSGSEFSRVKQHDAERDSIYPLRLIATWLRDCRQNHEQCRTNAPQFIPTRLISTYGSRPKLIPKGHFQTAPEYATLSHCWGQEKYDTLTSQDLQDYQVQGVPDSAIYKTFQDAIIVARDLNIPYIWIDSLCIMQDDNDDWVREAATMSSVYGHSALNIAASGAHDGRSGCFSPTLEPLRTFRVPSALGYEMTYSCFSMHYYKTSLADMPLMERGWTLQERLLPKRNLHFTTTQVFWECYQRIACEAFPDKFPTSLAYADVYLAKQPISRAMWGWIIERYATCKLTYSADKMIAISGLARHIQLHTGDQYVAGMWRDGLERQLCWKAVGSGYEGARRAPTWSWMSLDSQIWWSYFDYYIGAQQTKLWIKILSVEVQQAGNDPFGQVNSAHLRLSYTLLVHAKFEHTKIVDSSNERTTLMFMPQTTVQAQISLDEDWGDDEIRSAHILPVCSDLTSVRMHGLLLRKVIGVERQYVRVGRFAILEDEDRKALETALGEARTSLDTVEDKLEEMQGFIELV